MPAARPLRSARWWRCHPTSLPRSYRALVEAARGRLTSSARGRTGSSRSFLRLARRYEEFLHLVRLKPVVLDLGLRRRSSILGSPSCRRGGGYSATGLSDDEWSRRGEHFIRG